MNYKGLKRTEEKLKEIFRKKKKNKKKSWRIEKPNILIKKKGKKKYRDFNQDAAYEVEKKKIFEREKRKIIESEKRKIDDH